MPLISCVINVDTRPENSHNKEMFNGVVDRDFIVDGVVNKKNLFAGIDHEIIVFVDEHQPLSESVLSELRHVADTVIVRKHNKSFEDNNNFPAFNDLNYLSALFCARGKYIFHFDGDVAAFTSSKEDVLRYIEWLDHYDYVSYPSLWSPNPVDDPSFGGKYWVSTRFFCCKRDTIDFTEVLRCQTDYNYWTKRYPMPRTCHWTEHILASLSWHKGKGVYYPPIEFDKFILFTWENYHKYTFQRLNNQTFEEVRAWVSTKQYGYPNNLHI